VSPGCSIESGKLQEDLKQVSMHYESKCEDYKLLEDRLARTKAEYQTHINHLVKRYTRTIWSYYATQFFTHTVKSFNFMGLKFRGWTRMDMFVQTWIYGFQIIKKIGKYFIWVFNLCIAPPTKYTKLNIQWISRISQYMVLLLLTTMWFRIVFKY